MRKHNTDVETQALMGAWPDGRGRAAPGKLRKAGLFGAAMIVLAMCAGGVHAAGPATQPPAPLGVFGADMPGAGKWVISLSPSVVRNQSSQIGTTAVSPDDIVSNIVSGYTPIGSHLLRMVPDHVAIDSVAIGAAYGVSSNVTLTASTALLWKRLDMEAYKGLSGLAVLGYSDGRTSGIGDTSVAAIVRVFHNADSRVNFNLGFSLPTGSTTATQILLLPNNTAPAKRAFYAMQPGSGTFDLLAGAVYSGVRGAWSWGASYRARIPLGYSVEGWRYGALHEINGWAGYSMRPGLEATLRLNGSTQGAVSGRDLVVTGFAQGADPLFYGGRQIGIFGGLIVAGKYFGVKAAQLGLEGGAPLYQNLNGPQLARDYQLTMTLKYKL